jgi:hypothetical protein
MNTCIDTVLLIAIIWLCRRVAYRLIPSGNGQDGRGIGVRAPVSSRIFTSPYHPDWLWGVHPTSYATILRALYLGVMR